MSGTRRRGLPWRQAAARRAGEAEGRHDGGERSDGEGGPEGQAAAGATRHGGVGGGRLLVRLRAGWPG